MKIKHYKKLGYFYGEKNLAPWLVIQTGKQQGWNKYALESEEPIDPNLPALTLDDMRGVRFGINFLLQ